MTCGWCKESISTTVRRDAKYCSKRCRQSAWRFRRPIRRSRHVVDHRHDATLRLAYADPPYPGTAARYYADHPDYAGEVDHEDLVARLCDDYPDGWALSTSAAALTSVLKYCPMDVRVAAWFRGERPTMSYWPLSAWEPVIYRGGRPYMSPLQERRLDALTHVARARRTDPNPVIGAKPAAFCYWMFDLLGAVAGDVLDDLYPGSGGVTRAWEAYVVATTDTSVVDGRRIIGDLSRHDRTATEQTVFDLL